MATPFLRAASLAMGWVADRKLPRFLRKPVYRGYCALTGAGYDEALLALEDHPSLGAFFIRRLKPGARPVEADADKLPSPVDGTFQSIDRIEAGQVLQAKGRPYPIEELMGPAGEGIDFEGGTAWTVYLSPKDYHRIHSPETCRLTHAAWMDGARYSVAPKVLSKRPKVLSINERCALRLETERGPLVLVLVGALNVGRIRVLGIEPQQQGAPKKPLEFERGAELARFEMGSTIVLLAPPGGWTPSENIGEGQGIRLGEALGQWSGPNSAAGSDGL